MPVKLPRAKSKHEEHLALLIRLEGLEPPMREYVFHPDRKWRFDFAWELGAIAVEVDGGTYSGGRHTRGGGYEKDCEKMNEAALAGWRAFRFTPKMIASGRAMEILRRVIPRRVAKEELSPHVYTGGSSLTLPVLGWINQTIGPPNSTLMINNKPIEDIIDERIDERLKRDEKKAPASEDGVP